jgi:putative transposase
MPRANRTFLPGRIWHITHRCHKKEFLLKFRKDKRLWLKWARRAKSRYGLTILNFMITSNHIHMLVTTGRDARERRLQQGRRQSQETISRALQLIEARVAQEFNVRKDRRGAFWEDRYHATAIESGVQLARCLTYIDMNMVRAGVIKHPGEWPFCGYHELAQELATQRDQDRAHEHERERAHGLTRKPTPPRPRCRTRLVDSRELLELTGARDIRTLHRMRSAWIGAAIRKGELDREPVWTESVAVGSEEYLWQFQEESGRKIGVAEIEADGASNGLTVLRQTRRNPVCVLRGKNAGFGP